MTYATGKQAQGRLGLFELNFEVIHQGGVKHQKADVLLFLPTTGPDEYPFKDDVPVQTITNAQPRGKIQT